MVYLAVIALAGGIACGMAGLDQNFPVKLITANKDLILYILESPKKIAVFSPFISVFAEQCMEAMPFNGR